MGAFMSDIAFEDPIAAQPVTQSPVNQSNASHFGIAVMVAFAVVSVAIAFRHPGMIGIEYQSVDSILAGL
jgi:hypothetical protein